LGADGKEVWAKEAKVIVANKGAAVAKLPSSPPKPPASSTGPKPPAVKPAPPKEAVLKSERHGFQVSYPAGWVLTDQTTKMKPKWPGGFWFVFSRGPVAKADMAINLRHKTEPSPTTAEAFAQKPDNSYVNDWQKAQVNGKEAFGTTQGTPSSKRVIHRCIIVDGASIWMINCIDKTGGPPEQSRAFFDEVVNSLAPLGAAKPAAPKFGPPKAEIRPKPPAPPPPAPLPPAPPEAPPAEDLEATPAPEADEAVE